MRRLLTATVLSTSLVLLAGCSDRVTVSSTSPFPATRTSAAVPAHTQPQCRDVRGTLTASGNPGGTPRTATGRVRGDLTGAVTIVRGDVQKGPKGVGLLVQTYTFETKELGRFSGTNHSIILTPTRTLVPRGEVKLRSGASGAISFRGDIDSDPPRLTLTADYHGRICRPD